MFVNVKPLGYAYGEVLPSGHVNTVWANLSNAIDGSGGGSYTLIAGLDIDGSPVSIDQLVVPSVLQVDGNATFNGSTTAIGNSSGDALNVAAQATFTAALVANSNVTLGDSSSDSVTIKGTGSLQAPMVPSGAGRTPKRIKFAAADANASYGPKDWDAVIVTILTADRNYTIDDTGAVDGDWMLFINQSGSNVINLKDPGGGAISSYGATLARDWVVVVRSGGSWTGLLSGKRV